MKRILIIVLIFLFDNNYQSQVSIGNSSVPHSNVILNLSNINDRGLQLSKTTNIDQPEGVLYYDETHKLLNYTTDGNQVYSLSPWKFNPVDPLNNTYIDLSSSKIGIGTATPVVKFTLQGSNDADVNSSGTGLLLIGDSSSSHLLIDDNEIMAKNNNSSSTLYLQDEGGNVDINGSIMEYGFDLLPIGSVVIYYGTVDGNHPEISGVINQNWQICNGQGDTPDLRNLFIVGAGNNYDLGAKNGGAQGGSKTSTHTHNFDPNNTYSDDDYHTHTFGSSSSNHGGCTSSCVVGGDERDGNKPSHTHTFNSSSHDHSLNLDPKNTDGPIKSNGTSETENRPPYYALYYMMKIN